MFLSLSLTVPALALTLQAPTGLKQGQVAQFSVSGGTPGQTVGLVYGGGPPGACPPVLGGLCLSVANPVVVDTAVIGANGIAVLSATVPANAPLVNVRLQAAEVGAIPSVSAVRTLPVLTELTAALVVDDAADVDLLQHVWRALDLTFTNGAYPVAVTVPYLESAQYVFIDLNGSYRQLDLGLPALAEADLVYIFDVPTSASISAPALVASRSGNGVGVGVGGTAGDARIHLPNLVEASNVGVVSCPTGAVVVVDAPQVGPAVDVSFTAVGADVSGVLRDVQRVGRVTVSEHRASQVWVLESLAQATSVEVYGNTSLTTIARLGAPGMTVTTHATLQNNPALVDLSGWAPASTGSPWCQGNSSLPSCTCDAFMNTSATPYFANCNGNAPDSCSDDVYDLCS